MRSLRFRSSAERLRSSTRSTRSIRVRKGARRRYRRASRFSAGLREQALEIAEALVRSGAVEIIVIDSVAALFRSRRSRVTWARPTSDFRHAFYVSGTAQAVRIVSKTNCIIIFINQLREKVGVMYGNP